MPKESKEKFNKSDLERACGDLAMLRYWPAQAEAAVMHLLLQICPDRAALAWLVAELVNHVGEWPGPAEVRGLLCTRYDAADGIDAYCNLPGYRAEDGERRSLDEHEAHKTQERIDGFVGEGDRNLARQITRAAERMKLVN